ncbi:ArsR/SmtB family transcription factor [Halobellus rarus]|uniref:ArsR family transcriptional regulator n=1 Tax=Halobellus rarus TaxID=1126237 RepID=A0ABD6CR64_9EURY|nr:helix-turn-helix transcriptional regulator [Halobellus rarus]
MATGNLSDTVPEDGDHSTREDVVFSALSNRRRRLVVSVLREADEPLDIGTLSTQVAAREQDVDPSAITHRQRKSVYTALHQNHLPKLADAEFVTAEREWVGIRLADRADVLESHLRQNDASRSWPLWQVALSTGLCTTAAVALFPGSNLSGVVAATVATLFVTLVCFSLPADTRILSRI